MDLSSTAGSLTCDLSLAWEELEPTDGALLYSSPSSLFTTLSLASSETRGLCRMALSVSAIFVRLTGMTWWGNMLAPHLGMPRILYSNVGLNLKRCYTLLVSTTSWRTQLTNSGEQKQKPVLGLDPPSLS